MTQDDTPAARLRRVLTRLANDRRRSVAYYGNATGVPGASGTPRRLLSDYGFPTATQFQYVVPSPSHVTVNHEPRTALDLVTLHPYGLAEDRARLVATAAPQRRLGVPGGSGVATHPASARVLVSGGLDAETYAEAKTVALVQRATNPRQGPAHHFVVTRRGDVIVCAALDDEVQAAPAAAERAVSVALEGAVGVLVEDWEARRHDRLFELPYTEMQLFSLGVLVAKLRRAVPAIAASVRAAADGPGVAQLFPPGSGVVAQNFVAAAPAFASPLDHAPSNADAFLARVAAVPPFDLATQVFRAPEAPAARAVRAEARAAIAEADTTGRLSPMLAAYASLAGVERAHDMQQTPRARFFVQRIAAAHRDADDSGAAAQHVEAAAQDGSDEAPMQATGPHVFDFSTGLWGDGQTY